MSEQTLPEVGDVWRHTKTGVEYRVWEIVNIEHPETHEWVPGVMYYTRGTRYGGHYVRTMSRFLESFEFVSYG